MRTWETVLLATLLLLAPTAAAQDEPTVNESDYNTTAPEYDDSYLNESGQESTSNETTTTEGSTDDGTEPTVSEGDFDTSAPPADESYLDEAEGQLATEGSSGSGSASAGGSGAETPFAPLAGVLAALAVAGLLLRRR